MLLHRETTKKKIKKRCNRGVVFLCALLFCVLLGESVLSLSQINDADDLTRLMNDYFIKESELYALPEQYRTVSADGVRYLAYHQAVSTLGSFYIDKEDGCNPSATIAASVWSKQRENGYVIDRFYCSVMSLTITSRTNRTIEASVRYRVRFEGSAGLLNYTSAPQEPLTLREVYEQQVSFVHTSDGWKIRSFPGLEIFYVCYDGGVVLH